RFDTVLVNTGTGDLTGVQGHRVAQVRVVFSITQKAAATVLPRARGVELPSHLAYVEWFSRFGAAPEPSHLLYKVKRSIKNGEGLASIVPVLSIRRSTHLLPKFEPVAPPEWTSSNVLDQYSTFFVNPFTDRHAYTTVSILK
ncbi:hypothetical protein GGX14DRAFT_370897, partial [Mycena pura]